MSRCQFSIVTAVLVLAALPAAVGAATSPTITQSAVAGAKLGLSADQYRSLLGAPVSRAHGTASDPANPDDYSRLTFSKREMEVYFEGSTDRAIEITTWNKAYRTAAGVGPCSTVAALKHAYGSRVRPSKPNSQHGKVFGYVVGKTLFFASNDLHTVTAVAVFDPRTHGGKALNWASFVALNETNCS